MKIFCAILFSIIALNLGAATTPQAAYAEVKAGEAVLIDVREQEEVQEGMLKHAQWFPLSKIKNDPAWMKELKPLIKDKNIYLYCRTGNRSGQVKEILNEKGIQAQNLGGYRELREILE
jgi:phage shock protein E